ncbi:aromatic ring-hydroxylating dioxygenase subunit alpha [Paracoccaceae bacterium]|nr:aromatic ring-hydroxylating dioxygenase subunit alpha [Paracoccaceae bacterium]
MSLSDDGNALSESVQSLPSNWYYDDKFYKKELSSIWSKNWIYACHSNSLDGPRAYQTIKIGTQSIIVLRDRNGDLRAYYNTCRHRGSALCQEKTGKLKTPVFLCPYHQWSYSLEDGRLIKTSSFENPDNFIKEDYGLFKVKLQEWRGCIFINLDEESEWDIENLFQRSANELKRFPIEDMKVGSVWEKTIKCNWKSFWENFNECLHCPNVHPELSKLVPLFSKRIINSKDLPDWREKASSEDPKDKGGLREGAETWSFDGSAQGRIIKTLSSSDIARGQLYASSWPSVFIGGYADHVRIVRILPVGPEELELSVEWLFEENTLNDPSYDIQNVIEFAKLVMMQDGKACEINQLGMHSKAFEHGILMPEEYLLKRFQDWIRVQLDLPG